jgi:hypothetical protein
MSLAKIAKTAKIRGGKFRDSEFQKFGLKLWFFLAVLAVLARDIS